MKNLMLRLGKTPAQRTRTASTGRADGRFDARMPQERRL